MKALQLADEAEVTLPALCAHVLERYALQDRTLMTNDLLVQRFEQIQTRAAQAFAERFGDVLLRQAHEVVALRRQLLSQAEVDLGSARAQALKEASWQAAVQSLRPHTQKVRGEADGQRAADGPVDT